ncbi:MAG: DNA repair protein RecN [Alphaproteobacteria bacterium]|nr:DNA repair protein RecN [Alphaproteobacteria bacterium]
MLARLSIHNVVLIEKLVIEFRAGLCALTGETGAGKSILLDSLGLALGGRSDAGLVRKGADQAIVSAEFHAPQDHPVFALLDEQGLTHEGVLVLRRVISRDGRSRAFVNDQSVSVGLLKSVGDTLVEIHGQFETQGLLNPATHRALLDDYAGLSHRLPTLWGEWRNARDELEAARAGVEKARVDEAYLRAALEDIDELAPRAGEEEALTTLRDRLMRREQIVENLNAAHAAFTEAESAIISGLRALDRSGDDAREIVTLSEGASAQIGEALAGIEAISADLEEGGHDLQTVDDRLFALKGQARKLGCLIEELPEKRDELARQLNLIERMDDVLAELEGKVFSARKAFVAEAEWVSEGRKAAAERLDRLVAMELPPLKLDKARFSTSIERKDESEWGPEGFDRVRFLVATNPGAEPGPLGKIASGGEMARFMLALKVIMAEVGTAGSLIFDEVDSGIGGSTADAVGERLARLAAARQVLVVTHSPQVAARAGSHWIVMKSGQDDVTTTVIHLEGSRTRREEIARMLSGATITDEARAAAGKLLEAEETLHGSGTGQLR